MPRNTRTSGSKRRTLSIGGATYDLFVRLPADIVAKHTKEGTFALPLGAKIIVKEIIECCGGGANNTSVGFARLGCHASFEGVIGSDQWGEKLRENFRREGVNSECVTVVEGEVTSFSIILSGSSRERVILYQSGTNRHLHDMMFNKDIMKRVDWVYLNHIQEGSCVIQDDIAEILSEKGAPCLTWNPGGHQIRKGMSEKDNAHMLAHTDLLVLNKEEAAEFSGAATT
ncbi:carbohydrate kinase family protein, partial [Candidatus Peregrinibacteria bacterium]|nr:carbohydrate kinase family protein [Candidatus Peregrinibacteria bacterium]